MLTLRQQEIVHIFFLLEIKTKLLEDKLAFTAN